ncbi:MAG: hypothetical protein Q9222_001018 [Ikaeria aurantiellina]
MSNDDKASRSRYDTQPSRSPYDAQSSLSTHNKQTDRSPFDTTPSLSPYDGKSNRIPDDTQPSHFPYGTTHRHSAYDDKFSHSSAMVDLDYENLRKERAKLEHDDHKLKMKLQRQHEKAMTEEEKKKKRQEQKDLRIEEKKERRSEKLFERKVKAYDIADKQRKKNYEKRMDGHWMGYADRLGTDPMSDVRLVKRALGVEIRKRMPGTRLGKRGVVDIPKITDFNLLKKIWIHMLDVAKGCI